MSIYLKGKFSNAILRFNSSPFSFIVPIMRRIAWSSPKIFFFINRMRHHNDPFYWGEGDYFWVDGYPRSANTFASECMQIAFPDKRICSHSHAPSPVISAASQDKPGILVIREPKKAVASYAIYTGYTLFNCLDKYMQFYDRLLPYKQSIFVSEFSLTTSDPVQMIERFCRFYGLDVVSIDDGLDFEKEAILRIEKNYTGSDGVIDPKLIPRPEKSRKDKSEEHIQKMKESVVLRRMLNKCERLYEEFLVDAQTVENGS